MIKGTPGEKADQTTRKATATMAAISSWYPDTEIPEAELGAGAAGVDGAGAAGVEGADAAGVEGADAGDTHASSTVMASFCP